MATDIFHFEKSLAENDNKKKITIDNQGYLVDRNALNDVKEKIK